MTYDRKVFRASQDAIGAPGDDAAVNSTDDNTLVSLFKGVYHLLSSTGITVSGVSTAAKQDTGNASLSSIDTKLTTITGHVDGLEGFVDGLETLIGTTNTALTTLQGYVDGVETLTGAVTETAPANDTASSGLNGRLQRIAQRITSLIALVPASLGQKAMTGSFAVTLASDDPLTVLQSASSASVTALASSASSAQLLAANSARKGLILNNTDANAVLVKYGTTASATSFTVRIPLNGYWEMPKPIYTGRIDAIWEADGSGSLYATEM